MRQRLSTLSNFAATLACEAAEPEPETVVQIVESRVCGSAADSPVTESIREDRLESFKRDMPYRPVKVVPQVEQLIVRINIRFRVLFEVLSDVTNLEHCSPGEIKRFTGNDFLGE